MVSGGQKQTQTQTDVDTATDKRTDKHTDKQVGINMWICFLGFQLLCVSLSLSLCVSIYLSVSVSVYLSKINIKMMPSGGQSLQIETIHGTVKAGGRSVQVNQTSVVGESGNGRI